MEGGTRGGSDVPPLDAVEYLPIDERKVSLSVESLWLLY